MHMASLISTSQTQRSCFALKPFHAQAPRMRGPPKVALVCQQDNHVDRPSSPATSVLILVISGNLRAYLTKLPAWATPTLAISVILFALHGLVWFLSLVPTQKHQLSICNGLPENTELPESFFNSLIDGQNVLVLQPSWLSLPCS